MFETAEMRASRISTVNACASSACNDIKLYDRPFHLQSSQKHSLVIFIFTQSISCTHQHLNSITTWFACNANCLKSPSSVRGDPCAKITSLNADRDSSMLGSALSCRQIYSALTISSISSCCSTVFNPSMTPGISWVMTSFATWSL